MLQLGALSLVVMAATVLGATTVPGPAFDTLDNTNLDALNRELRKSLLVKVSSELESAERYMDNLQPRITACQQKVHANTNSCITCMDNACQRMYDHCPTLTINHQSQGGSSVSSSSVNGQVKITVCSLMMSSAARTCETIMNPAGYMVNSINQINNRLVIRLQKMSGDLGGSVVNGFVNGISTVVNGLNNNFNQSMTPEQEAAFHNSMQHMQNSLHHAMQGLSTSLSGIGPQINAAMQNMAQGLNNQMGGFGNDMGNWANHFSQSLSSTLSHMFDGMFGRRFIRAAPDCTVTLTEMVQKCSPLAAHCSPCQSAPINDTLLQNECGQDLVQKVVAVEKSMKQLEQIFSEISNAQNILTKVQFDNHLLDPSTIAYGNVLLTANIRGHTEILPTTAQLMLRNLPATADAITPVVWKSWASHSA